MVEVLAQPDAVVRAGGVVDDSRRGKRRRLELGHGPVIRRPDLLGELLVPGGERGGAALEHGARRLEAGGIAGIAATAFAVRRRRSVPPTRRHRSSLVDVLGSLLGQEAAQRLIESEARGPRGDAGVGLLERDPGRPLHRLGQVRGARAEGVREIVADDRGARRAARTGCRSATLTAHPSATSSIRTTPTFQPTGTSRLKRTATITVNAAWPIANGVVPGEYAATNTATGNAIHSAV